MPEGVKVIKADIQDEARVASLLEGTFWDCVCDFIGFVPAQVERDWRLFRGGLIGDKAMTVLFDNSKLKRAVPGFQATVRFEEGVARTLENILTHPELQVPDPEFDAWCDRVLSVIDNAKSQLHHFS